MLLTKVPDAVHGDLDSLRGDVKEYYSSLGSAITRDPEQYSTDFGKALRKIREVPGSCNSKEVVVLGSLAGRVDHAIGILSQILRESREHPQTKLWLLSESSLSFLLGEGEYKLYFRFAENRFGQNIGILPVYGPAIISTKGLRWDVTDWHTEMGGQISTSNRVDSETVIIKTNRSVLFTIELSSQFLGSD